jgi:hypothetical protein
MFSSTFLFHLSTVTWLSTTRGGFWIDDRISWTLWHSAWLHFIVHYYTYKVVSTVTSSPPLLGSGFERRTFPVPQLPASHSNRSRLNLSSSLTHWLIHNQLIQTHCHFLAVVLVQFVDGSTAAVCMDIYSTVPCCVGTHQHQFLLNVWIMNIYLGDIFIGTFLLTDCMMWNLSLLHGAPVQGSHSLHSTSVPNPTHLRPTASVHHFHRNKGLTLISCTYHCASSHSTKMSSQSLYFSKTCFRIPD